MKYIKLYILAAFVAFAAASCNNSEKETGTTATDNRTAKDAYGTAPNISTETDITIIGSGNDMQSIRFDRNEIRVPANSEVKITLVNNSSGQGMEHNFVVVQSDKVKEVAVSGFQAGKQNNYVPTDQALRQYVYASSPLADMGQTVNFTFKAPAPGTYTFVCTVPGHWQNMQGRFIVE